ATGDFFTNNSVFNGGSTSWPCVEDFDFDLRCGGLDEAIAEDSFLCRTVNCGLTGDRAAVNDRMLNAVLALKQFAPDPSMLAHNLRIPIRLASGGPSAGDVAGQYGPNVTAIERRQIPINQVNQPLDIVNIKDDTTSMDLNN